ncbi:hypothetical protein HOH87_03975 [bacterium]|jgi:hypothetical protein|nr:hypothetical protein [bacterium]
MQGLTTPAVRAFKHIGPVVFRGFGTTTSTVTKAQHVPQTDPNSKDVEGLAKKLSHHSGLENVPTATLVKDAALFGAMVLISKCPATARAGIMKATEIALDNPVGHPIVRWAFSSFYAGETLEEARLNTSDSPGTIGCYNLVNEYCKTEEQIETAFEQVSGMFVGETRLRPPEIAALKVTGSLFLEEVLLTMQNLLENGKKLPEFKVLLDYAKNPNNTYPDNESLITPDDFGDLKKTFLNSIDRCERLGNLSIASGVRLQMDAEKSNVQLAIHETAKCLILHFNTNDQAVYGEVLQNYLQNGGDRIDDTNLLTKTNNLATINRAVRGAYMLSEPEGIIHTTKSGTDDTYRNSVEKGAQGTTLNQNSEFMVATHNVTDMAITMILNRNPGTKLILGRLAGLRTAQSNNALKSGQTVLEYRVVGGINKAFPFLIRRGVELIEPPPKGQQLLAREERDIRVEEVAHRVKKGPDQFRNKVDNLILPLMS